MICLTKGIIKIVLFLFIIYFADLIIGSCLERLFYKGKYNTVNPVNNCFFNVQSDIIILGNSRAQHHYVPEKITAVLGKSCFNCGVDGGHSIFFFYAELIILLRRYTPEIVILEIDPYDYYYEKTHYDKLSILSPFYNNDSEVDSIIHLRNNFEKYKYISKIYPYNSMVFNLIKSEFIDEKKANYYNGYQPLNYKINFNVKRINDEKRILTKLIDEKKIEVLNKFINICNKYGILLLVFKSPILLPDSNYEIRYAEHIVSDILKEKNIIYFDNSDMTNFSDNKEMFADRGHLNNYGAHKYTEIIANQIYQLLYR